MPRFESTSSRARAFELCLKNRSIASLCKDCDDSIVSGRSSAFLGVLFSIPSHEQHYRKTGEKETHPKTRSRFGSIKSSNSAASENHPKLFRLPEVKLTV